MFRFGGDAGELRFAPRQDDGLDFHDWRSLLLESASLREDRRAGRRRAWRHVRPGALAMAACGVALIPLQRGPEMFHSPLWFAGPLAIVASVALTSLMAMRTASPVHVRTAPGENRSLVAGSGPS